ncbi:MAG TPA: NAD(P)-binding protein [Polyangiaceae bacterium]|nr:NAD(P)-binding protein [Polyangiaceae bacterium]
MTNLPTDLTAPPDLGHEHRIGPRRVERPIYEDILPPCNHACPAGEDIQGWLALAQAGQHEQAWRHLMRDNPMPAVHGRVCYHPCESNCNRAQLDSSVAIHAVERFLGDRARAEGWKPVPDAPPSGKRVLVVGAGPSGLSAAYHLARRGHAVQIHEAGPLAGGMMHFGIPAYRLPRDVLSAEIAGIEAMGVEIVLNHKVEDLIAEQLAGGFQAVFLALGAHIGKRTEIPSRDAGKIFDAVSFLRQAGAGEAPRLGRRVAIYGAGNTAMDAARVARRLGHEPLIIYRRDRAHMPAHEFEADEALEEGVKIHWLRSIRAMDEESLTVEVMTLDANGRPQPTGQTETLEADAIILALGQDVDSAFLRQVPGIAAKADGTVVVDENLMTGVPGIFAGGDMVPSERTVTVAVGHGKKVARAIDAYLRGAPVARAEKKPLASFDKLHTWFFVDAGQRPQPQLERARRIASFDEVVGGLSETAAVYEAKRCLSCGNCFECDGCFGACPEDAVIKLGKGLRYRFDYDRCTGCAICFQQCPCHAIEMVTEPAASGEPQS